MPTVKAILEEFVENYRAKVDPNEAMIVQFNVAPAGQVWHVVIEPGQQVCLVEGPHPDARFIILANETILEQVYNGQISAMTAGARAKMSDPAPLDFKMGEGVSFSPEIYAGLLTFVQRFFNRFDPERILFDEAHARLVHGGHAVALYYHTGFRSAWYQIRKGERVNETGDSNPFPQAFVIVSGSGMAKFGEKTLSIKAGESYYVPAGEDQVVWNESDQPLEFVWLAWGEGA
jgi:mannose-6-phosphate isomerase-like protein (cupin superfamily)